MHPRLLRAARYGRPFVPFPEGEGATGDNGGGAGGTGAPPASPNGFPPGVPVEQMAAGEQTAYWRHYARQHEARAKEATEWRKANEATVAEHAKLVEASRTEAEKALAEATAKAKAEGERAGRAETIPALVAAEFRAATGLPADKVAELLAPLDKTYFLAADGTVDAAKVTSYCTTNAALIGTGERKAPAGFPDLGQGNRGNQNKPSGKEAGLAEARKRGFLKEPASA